MKSTRLLEIVGQQIMPLAARILCQSVDEFEYPGVYLYYPSDRHILALATITFTSKG